MLRQRMQKAILILSLAPICSYASAAWVRVSVSEAGNTYVDTATILRAGEIVTMSEMTDYKIVADPNFAYKSVRRQYQFDCKAKRSRSLSTAAYAGRMGQGEMVNSAETPTAEWVTVV